MRILIILFLLSFTLAQANFKRLDSLGLRAIDGFVTTQMEFEMMVGLSVGIIREGEVAFLQGFGYENLTPEIFATEDTHYRLASISKVLTGILAMQLIERGDLDLNADIRDYVPEYPVKPEGVITSEELLSHESGIQHYGSYNSSARNAYILQHTGDYDPIASLDVFKDRPLQFAPGAEYTYTSFGFNLMGAVVERAGDQPYEQQVQERITIPLQLPYLSPEFQDLRPFIHQAAGYEVSGDSVIPSLPSSDITDVTWKLASGGFISSVIDLTLLIQGFINNTVLSDSMKNFMGTRHKTPDSVSTGYGYGISSSTRNGDKLYYHSGSQAKTATVIYFSPENKNGVALMTNTRRASMYPLARLIYDYLPSTTLTGSPYVIPPRVTALIPTMQDKLTLYYTPGSSQIKLALPFKTRATFNIRLYSLRGNIIASWKQVSDNGEINLNHEIRPGLYQLTVRESSGKHLYNSKLVIH